MSRYLNEQEARETITDRLRRNGVDKRTAEREADGSVGRVMDTYDKRDGLSQAERARKPKEN